jgi:hypothetical protein
MQQNCSKGEQMQNTSTDQQNNNSGLIKDPEDWKSGDDPATPAQRSYLETLAQQANEEAPEEGLTKAEASEEIDRLRQQAGLDQ